MTAPRESLMEADRQVEHQGVVWDTLRRIAAELDRLRIPYAVVGGIALQHFGVKRSTRNVDLVVTPDDLLRIHEKLVGHGYRIDSKDNRHLRDDTTRIRIEFLVSGEFPGDGEPKPVQFPIPTNVAERSPD